MFFTHYDMRSAACDTKKQIAHDGEHDSQNTPDVVNS